MGAGFSEVTSNPISAVEDQRRGVSALREAVAS